jgi:hypothetical protein
MSYIIECNTVDPHSPAQNQGVGRHDTRAGMKFLHRVNGKPQEFTTLDGVAKEVLRLTAQGIGFTGQDKSRIATNYEVKRANSQDSQATLGLPLSAAEKKDLLRINQGLAAQLPASSPLRLGAAPRMAP